MSLSRSIARRFSSVLLTALVCLVGPQTIAQSQAADVVVSDDADLKVPDGDAAQLLAFIEKAANPQEQFTSDEELHKYLDAVSKAIAEASDKILAGNSTERQKIDAIEWKVEALRIRHKLGDDSSDKQTDEFLASVNTKGQPALQKAIEKVRLGVEQERQNRAAMEQQMELRTKLRQWTQLDEAEQTKATDWLIEIVKAEPNGAHASMLTMFADSVSDSNVDLAKRAIRELLPVLSKSDDPGVQGRLPMLDGMLRRLDLPGNQMDVAGTFLDGTKVDWASYRGKVVLVDYWATWCGPCRAEVPNVLENYLKYHDKGFDVIGISLDDTREAAEEYVQQTNIPWQSIFNDVEGQRGWQTPMAVKYGITGIPTAILIDQEGKVVSMNARGPRLGALLEKLLGKSGEEAAATDDRKSEQTAQSAR